MMPLYVEQLGMMTSVGLNWRQTISSLRCGISRPRDLAIAAPDGEPLSACAVPLSTESGAGRERMALMAAAALTECSAGREGTKLPLVLCCPDANDIAYEPSQLVRALHDWTGVVDEKAVVPITGGHAAIGEALVQAQAILREGRYDGCYVGAVDTMLDVDRLKRLMKSSRIASSRTPDGFSPGEGSCFLRISTNPSTEGRIEIAGLGLEHETSAGRESGKVTGRAQAKAMRQAVADAGSETGAVGVVGTDVTGERHRFYEVALAITRLKLRRVERLELGPFLGEVGCALGAITLAYLTAALDSGWIGQDGRGAMYLGANDTSLRTAALVRRKTNG
jgi:hypothetical protein